MLDSTKNAGAQEIKDLRDHDKRRRRGGKDGETG